MRIPEDTICKICQSVFCCAQCRHKHEINNHAIVVRKPIMITTSVTTTTTSTSSIAATASSVGSQNTETSNSAADIADQASFETIYLFCPICAKHPLPLQQEIFNEMLVHVETHHLPLRCEKCAKMYYTINDLKEFTKCMRPTTLCMSQESEAGLRSCYNNTSKTTVPKTMSAAHNSPMRRHDFNDSHMTPISIINMRWKAKSNKATHEEFISDSVSSIKNISSISNSSVRRSIGVTSGVPGKVIRSTSTPVHLEMVFAKPKEQTFNATSYGHMSSIQYSSGCESETSPALPHLSSQALEPINRYRKVGGARPKMTAVTPLRQVMSKSIQKAFAEHGLPAASTAVRGGSAAFQRKQMFDTTSSPSINYNSGHDKKIVSPAPPALDLRLSPAVRRSQSESEDNSKLQISGDQQKQTDSIDVPLTRRNILLSAQKLTTESIVITRTEHLSSVSASTSAGSSHGSVNTIKPHTSTNSSYQSVNSNNSAGSVFKSCSSVEIITATTKKIQQVESVETVASIGHRPLVPNTPTARIPGALIHKKIINFETPKVGSSDSRESHNSSVDVFFTPNSSPMRSNGSDVDISEGENTEIRSRHLMVKQNLIGRFSQIRKPALKDCAHSTAFSRIENLTMDTIASNINDGEYGDDDEVFLEQTNEIILEPKSPEYKSKASDTPNPSSLWSIMSSVMGIPSRKTSMTKSTSKNETSVLLDSNKKTIIKRCASIAGSLVRSRPLIDEKELQPIKRKRTFTVDEQSSSTYLSLRNNSEATSPTNDNFNVSSKRFRIQGRRPIDRMRLNS